MNKPDSELEGTLDHIVYSSDETGFIVARLDVKAEPKPITITGILTGANIGDYLLLKGRWEIHPEYGQQFRVMSYQAEQPVTVEGIVKYLSNSLIKGIGPKTAKKIVKQWGTESLEIIENEPDRLSEIQGIGKHKQALIKKGWQDQKAVKNLMLFLHKYGISSSIAHKLYKQYGEQAYHVIKTNPYKLSADIYGIGFITADKIALKLGLEPFSPQRIEAAIIYLLAKAADDGHCFVENRKLCLDCLKLLEVSSINSHRDSLSLIRTQLLTMAKSDKVILTPYTYSKHSTKNQELRTKNQELRTLNPKLFPDDVVVYHPAYYWAELNSASKLISLLSTASNSLQCFKEVDWDKAFDWLHSSMCQDRTDKKISYSEEQKKGIVKCLTNKVVILTGGPGTGKSTVTAGIVKLVTAKKKKVLLAAPTGRAAKRLTEVTGKPAQTIHRLLEFSWQNGLQFQRNNNNPLDADLIIIDEVSMLDVLLLNHLLKAIREDTNLIIIGDVDQLPSVGAGYVLKDLQESASVPVVTLNKIFRQSETSHIITNAHRIKQGNMPVFTQGKGDFFLFGASTPEKSVATTVELVTKKIPDSFGFSPLNDIQILAPMHKGTAGIIELNRILQNRLNPSSRQENEIVLGSRIYRKNDRVIQTKNNYEKEVFNGDFGRIKAINKEMQTVSIDFENTGSTRSILTVEYDYSDLDQITHAYAISIHKSQGSEFPVVVLPLSTQHYIMLQRNLLYTAVTRAKSLLVIVGSQAAIGIALKNDKSTFRNTRLAGIMRELYNRIH